VTSELTSDVAGPRVGRDGAHRPPDVTAAASDTKGAPQLALTVVVGLGALAAYELERAARITARLANEDTSLIWVAARDWMAGRPRQPNFYGQSYGSTLEGIPIGIAHALGAAYGPATGFVLGGIEWLGWALLAWAAWRQAHRVVAALAVGMPVVLAAYHSVYVTIELQAPGPRLLVIAAAALLIAMPKQPAALAGAVLLLGVGLQFDAASAVLAVPLVAWFALSLLRSRGQMYAIAVGAVVPAALFIGTRLFYRRHPDYAFHLSPSFRPSGSTLKGSIQHLPEFFALYAPELWRSWVVPIVILAFLVGVLLATRRTAYALPGALAGAIVLYAMSTSRARPESSLGPLLPRGRILLALPATIWFLCFLVAESGLLDTVRARIGIRPMLAAICIVCVASTVLRVADFDSREGSWYARSIALGRQGAYGFVPNAAVERQCDADFTFARRHHIGLIVYQAQHSAYSCAARAPSGITTLVAGFERRTWALYDELHHPRSSMLLSAPPARLCALARQRAACTQDDRLVVLTFPSQPALPLLTALGFAYRGFGPQCQPAAILSSCRGDRGADLGRRPFGRPPADPDQARAAITTAYETMFSLAPNGATLPSVEFGDQLGDLADQLVHAGEPANAATVVGVRFLDDHEATVRFRIGRSVTSGEAVMQDAQWRVALPTFCSAASRHATRTQLAALALQHACYNRVVRS
jgi:hypothetical protein